MTDAGALSDQERDRGRTAERPGRVPLRGWKDVILRTKQQMKLDDVPLLAAGVAFFALLALVPALVALVSVYGLVADPADIQRNVDDLLAGGPGRGPRPGVIAALVHRRQLSVGPAAGRDRRPRDRALVGVERREAPRRRDQPGLRRGGERGPPPPAGPGPAADHRRHRADGGGRRRLRRRPPGAARERCRRRRAGRCCSWSAGRCSPWWPSSSWRCSTGGARTATPRSGGG